MSGGTTSRGRKLCAIVSAIGSCVLIAGCGRTLHDADATLRDKGVADRCADFMYRAFPGADIKITSRQAAPDPGSGDFATSVARIEGTRTRVPAEQSIAVRDVAVVCRFENGVLTNFHWVQGPLK